LALLKLVAANDTFGALVAMTDVLDGKLALFVTAPEVNGKMPETFGLPDEAPEGVALIVESSGSTGTPKRIEISREALLESANASALALGSFEGTAQWLLALPLNYIAGLNVLARSVLAGTQPVMMNTSVPFTPEAFSNSARHMTGDRRYTSLVPTQLARLAKAIDQDEFLLSQLRRFDAILVGGQAPQDEVVQKLRALDVNIVITYGMTETCGGCVYNSQPLAGVELKTVEGRIVIRGPVLANVETDSDGFYLTNDEGIVYADGRLEVLGRIDRVIVSGGIKISLDRVEQLAAQVAGVAELAASAIDDSEWGQRVGIVFVGSPEVSEDIASALADDLGPAGRPVRILRIDALPKLNSGKHDLLAIKQIFEEN
jgi:O-succinylbenzoic acid--CoA ligase